jgi:hypothetical protein
MSPNPNKAIRGCGPLSTPGFFDSLNKPFGLVCSCQLMVYFIKA